MCPIRSGQIIYELSGVPNFIGIKALRKAADKMPFKTKVVRLVY
jgi:ribosomal protein L16/L10AE